MYIDKCIWKTITFLKVLFLLGVLLFMDENESFRDLCHALPGVLSCLKFMDPELSELKCSSERDVTLPTL